MPRQQVATDGVSDRGYQARQEACTLSVVIAHWNGARMLCACLDSLYAACQDLDVQVIVVDNGSTDNSVSTLRREYRAVDLIENRQNVGFAAATNQGLARATGRFVMLLNNDTVVLDKAPVRMVHLLQAHADVGAVGPQLLNQDRTVQPSCMPYPSLLRNPLSFFGFKLPYRPPMTCHGRAYVPVRAVKGACMVIRREALKSVGKLDEGYFMYGEESDWCYRAHKQGWKIAHLPSAKVVHLGEQTASRQPARFYIERRRSHIRFVLKHHGMLAGRVDAFLFRLAIVCHAAFHQASREFYKNLLPAYDDMVSMLLSEVHSNM